MKQVVFVIALTVFGINANASNAWKRTVRCADSLAAKFFYVNAIQKYEKALAAMPKDSGVLVYSKIASAHYAAGNNVDALHYYELFLKKGTPDEKVVFQYARTLQANGLQDKASKLYGQMYAKYNKAIYQQYEEKAKEIETSHGDRKEATVKRMSFNTGGSEYAPAYYKGSLSFTSVATKDAPENRRIRWNETPFTDLYIEDDNGKVSKLDGINSLRNDGAATFSADGKHIYFTQNHPGHKYRNNLQLVESNWDRDEWEKPEVLEFQNKKYSYAHPFAANEGKTLYFSSDMPGGMGGMDLYKIELNDTGGWNSPINLGDKINTAGNDVFPYLATDGLFYFTSDGRPGYGRLDIYVAKGNEVAHLPSPVNSEADDLSMIFDANRNKGYLASNREGSDDIFAVNYIQQPSRKKETEEVEVKQTLVTLTVTDAANKQPLEGAHVELSKDGGNGQFYETNAEGKIFVPAKVLASSVVSARMKGYVDQTATLAAQGGETVNLGLVAIKPLAESFTTALYYQNNETNLDSEDLNKLRELISKYNSTKKSQVIINGFASDKGTSQYNMSLSFSRAQKASLFLSDQGIPANIIKMNFYGALEIDAACRKSKKCVEENLREGRKVEIKLITE
jgi:outer membrane protein OmpA-like peptidoglycan-associated protein